MVGFVVFHSFVLELTVVIEPYATGVSKAAAVRRYPYTECCDIVSHKTTATSVDSSGVFLPGIIGRVNSDRTATLSAVPEKTDLYTAGGSRSPSGHFDGVGWAGKAVKIARQLVADVYVISLG